MIAAIISQDAALSGGLEAALEGVGVVKAAQPGLERSPSSNNALRILIAEDSDDAFFLIQTYLKDEPNIVTRAVNGAEAVDLATIETFDIVFMDIRMPVMDGHEATRRIRKWETGKTRARMPIVVLSADDLLSQRHQGALAGCSGHLASAEPPVLASRS